MGTDLLGTSPTWLFLAPEVSVPTSLLHFLLSWMDITVLMSRWWLLGLLSGTQSTESILSVYYDCFLLQTPLFSIIDFLCLLSQSDAFDLVSPELSKGRLRLSGIVTDSVSPDACRCLFVLSWNDWDHCRRGSESPSHADISPCINITPGQPFLVFQGSYHLSDENMLTASFPGKSINAVSEWSIEELERKLICEYKQKWENNLKEKKGH